MKRLGWIALILLAATTLQAQALLDQPVATIKFEKTTSLIGQKAFRERIAAIEAQGKKLDLEEKKAQLEDMISSELIKMDMEAQGIRGTDEDLLKQFRASNPGLTDTQIRQEVEKQSGQSWDVATTGLKRQVANMKYFNTFPQAQEIGKVSVSEKEIQEAFDGNPSINTAPDFIRVSHIFFDTKVKPKGTLAEIQKKADDTLKRITSGQSTFEEMAIAISDDATSARVNGDLGYLPRPQDDAAGQQMLTIFGRPFLDAVFALKKGEVSSVLTSNSGLHIVRVTSKIEKHFKTLDEPYFPGKDGTVRQYLQQVLQQRKAVAAQTKMVQEIAEGLKKKATIKTFEQNF